MKHGYARVSAEDQNPAMQVAVLKRAGWKTVLKDEMTGAHVNRPTLTRCLRKLGTGDTIVVWKLDPPDGSLRDLTTMLDDFRSNGIMFLSLTEAIDTETPTGRAIGQMIGLATEFERSLITEHIHANVNTAQKRGVKFRPKVKLTPDRLAHARKLIEQGTTATHAANIIGIGRTTLYDALQREAA